MTPVGRCSFHFVSPVNYDEIRFSVPLKELSRDLHTSDIFQRRTQAASLPLVRRWEKLLNNFCLDNRLTVHIKSFIILSYYPVDTRKMRSS